MVQCLPIMWETRVRALGQEDPLEKEMATQSSTLAWKTPWMEATVHGVAKSHTQLGNFTFSFTSLIHIYINISFHTHFISYTHTHTHTHTHTQKHKCAQWLSHVWLCDPLDCGLPGSSVHGIFQARTLEWLLFPPPGDLSHPVTELASPTSAGRFFSTEPPGKTHKHIRTHYLGRNKQCPNVSLKVIINIILYSHDNLEEISNIANDSRSF